MLLLESKELAERIDLHELQACGSEDLIARHDSIGSRKHAVRAGIAVADRVGQERVVGGHEGKIDAPCIDPDTRHGLAMPARGRPQADEHLLPEPHEIPYQLAAHGNRPVVKPVDLVQFQQPAVEGTRHDPTA